LLRCDPHKNFFGINSTYIFNDTRSPIYRKNRQPLHINNNETPVQFNSLLFQILTVQNIIFHIYAPIMYLYYWTTFGIKAIAIISEVAQKSSSEDLPATAVAVAAVDADGTAAPAGKPAGCDAAPHQ
jgi:hypothetical protein